MHQKPFKDGGSGRSYFKKLIYKVFTKFHDNNKALYEIVN